MSETAELVEVDPRFPVGKFQRPESVTAHDRMKAIAAIAAMPAMLSASVKGLDREQLDTPYREGGWTVRQLVHHIADSHMNALLRIRLALTEDWPTITAYNEKAWAELRDSMTAPVGWSVDLLADLHARWVMLLRTLVSGFPDPHTGWLSLAMASTLAGNLTITGSVANIIVVERAAAEGVHVGFREYFRVGLPVTTATLAVGSLWLWLT